MKGEGGGGHDGNSDAEVRAGWAPRRAHLPSGLRGFVNGQTHDQARLCELQLLLVLGQCPLDLAKKARDTGEHATLTLHQRLHHTPLCASQTHLSFGRPPLVPPRAPPGRPPQYSTADPTHQLQLILCLLHAALQQWRQHARQAVSQRLVAASEQLREATASEQTGGSGWTDGAKEAGRGGACPLPEMVLVEQRALLSPLTSPATTCISVTLLSVLLLSASLLRVLIRKPAACRAGRRTGVGKATTGGAARGGEVDAVGGHDRRWPDHTA